MEESNSYNFKFSEMFFGIVNRITDPEPEKLV